MIRRDHDSFWWFKVHKHQIDNLNRTHKSWYKIGKRSVTCKHLLNFNTSLNLGSWDICWNSSKRDGQKLTLLLSVSFCPKLGQNWFFSTTSWWNRDFPSDCTTQKPFPDYQRPRILYPCWWMISKSNMVIQHNWYKILSKRLWSKNQRTVCHTKQRLMHNS